MDFRRPGCIWAAAGFALGLAAFAALALIGAWSRPAALASSRAEPTLIIVLNPSATPVPPTAIEPTAGPAPATAEPTGPAPSGGPWKPGDLVAVYGTGGDGLRLRSQASISASIRMLALDNEVFQVQQGPVQADGRTWYFVVNPFDNTHAGWAVADFLRPAVSP